MRNLGNVLKVQVLQYIIVLRKIPFLHQNLQQFLIQILFQRKIYSVICILYILCKIYTPKLVTVKPFSVIILFRDWVKVEF